jgi:branched-chain amino acid transport system permease protein
VARHVGINTARAKVVLFVISSTFAAITGALVAPRWSYVEPSIAFSPFLTFEVVIMALLGGVHRLWGPLLGVIPFTLLWEFISAKFPAQTTLLLGVSFLLIVYVIPRGVVGLVEDMIRRRRGTPGSADAGGMFAWAKALLKKALLNKAMLQKAMLQRRKRGHA